MLYPEPYIAFLVEFHATRDYFECHELLEEYWKTLPQGAGDAELWVGLIQIAVAQYHHRRGNRDGALKMFRQASLRLDAGALKRLGLDGDGVLRIVDERLAALERGPDDCLFREFDLPVADEALMRLCLEACARRSVRWGAPSRLDDERLIHRHTLRDRTYVHEARAEAYRKKRL